MEICYLPGKMELSFCQAASSYRNYHLPYGVSYRLDNSWQMLPADMFQTTNNPH